jgi:hypothetical protein
MNKIRMTTNTLLLLFISVIAGGLSYFQYIYKAKKNENRLVLAFLRFYPFWYFIVVDKSNTDQNTLETVKHLAYNVDNSSSIAFLKANENVWNYMKNRIKFRFTR